MKNPCLGTLLFVTAVASSLARTAGAEPSPADRATARALAEEGEDALEKKNYAVAADRFSRADSLVHAPTLLLELARAEVGMRKFVEAQENYQRILREGVAPGTPPAFARAYHDAEKEIAAIPPKLGWVVINVEGPVGPMLFIDDMQVPAAALGVRRAVNPGNHTIKASADGFLPNETTFSVREGDSAAVSLTLERAPTAAPALAASKGESANAPGAGTGGLGTSAPGRDAATAQPHSGQKTSAFIALGVGAAGLAVGAVTGAVALGKHGQLADSCTEGHCQPSQESMLDSFRAMAAVSTVGFIVGGVGAATGAILLLTLPKKHAATAASTSVKPLIGLGTVGAEVTF